LISTGLPPKPKKKLFFIELLNQFLTHKLNNKTKAQVILLNFLDKIIEYPITPHFKAKQYETISLHPLVMEPCELGGLNMTNKQTTLIHPSVVCAVSSSVNTTFMLCCSKV
jgi:hypothetical protein